LIAWSRVLKMNMREKRAPVTEHVCIEFAAST